jgi:hypothetical protein
MTDFYDEGLSNVRGLGFEGDESLSPAQGLRRLPWQRNCSA